MNPNLQAWLLLVQLLGSSAGQLIGQDVGGTTGAAIAADSQLAADLLGIANQSLALRSQLTGEDISIVRGMIHTLPTS